MWIKNRAGIDHHEADTTEILFIKHLNAEQDQQDCP